MKHSKRRLNKKKVFLVATFIILLVVIIININKEKDSKKEASLNETENGNNIENTTIVVDTGKKENNETVSESQSSLKPKYDYSKLSAEELDRFDKIYDETDTKSVYLTFDDGPTKQVTPFILDLLKEENVKATFFVLGQRVEANPELVKREYDEGHFIASHGYSHMYSEIYAHMAGFYYEYDTTNDAIKAAIGDDSFNSIVFRFPGGSVGGPYDSFKKAVKQKLREQGVASIDWNALTGDSEGGTKTKEKLLNRFYETIGNKSNAVVLMHDAADKILSYEVLPEIISYCREKGYEFKTMYDVLLRDN